MPLTACAPKICMYGGKQVRCAAEMMSGQKETALTTIACEIPMPRTEEIYVLRSEVPTRGGQISDLVTTDRCNGFTTRCILEKIQLLCWLTIVQEKPPYGRFAGTNELHCFESWLWSFTKECVTNQSEIAAHYDEKVISGIRLSSWLFIADARTLQRKLLSPSKIGLSFRTLNWRHPRKESLEAEIHQLNDPEVLRRKTFRFKYSATAFSPELSIHRNAQYCLLENKKNVHCLQNEPKERKCSNQICLHFCLLCHQLRMRRM